MSAASHGTTDPQFFFSRLSVRFRQLPTSFARLAFTMSMKRSSEKSPSLPNSISFMKKYRTASGPYLATSSVGSSTFPRLLPILSPSFVRKPWP